MCVILDKLFGFLHALNLQDVGFMRTYTYIYINKYISIYKIRYISWQLLETLKHSDVIDWEFNRNKNIACLKVLPLSQAFFLLWRSYSIPESVLCHSSCKDMLWNDSFLQKNLPRQHCYLKCHKDIPNCWQKTCIYVFNVCFRQQYAYAVLETLSLGGYYFAQMWLLHLQSADHPFLVYLSLH